MVYKQKREVINLSKIPSATLITITIDGKEQAMTKEGLHQIVALGLDLKAREKPLTKSQESARIRHITQYLADGYLDEGMAKVQELAGLGGPFYHHPGELRDRFLKAAKTFGYGRDDITALKDVLAEYLTES